MTTQLGLFDKPDPSSRADQILARFKAFCKSNPIIWKLFERFTLELISNGREFYSSDAIFHRIRWHMDVEIRTDGQIKLNDHYTAYYARLFHVAHPEYDGFFRKRKRISEEHPASDNDRQEFIGPDAGEEKKLEDDLRDLL